MMRFSCLATRCLILAWGLGLVMLCMPASAHRPDLPISPESSQYVNERTQFQLHTLLTEQRHPETWNLSEVAADDPERALEQLFSVDKDIVRAFAALADDPQRMAGLHLASQAVQHALRGGHRIYFYGTGATGRLAQTLESALWRPFWKRLRHDPVWPQIANVLTDAENRVRGEITGGDRALISSLEGFEDLPLIGALQLSDNGITSHDVVFAVTEGGETSAVIGTALAAADQAGPGTERVWFVYNNPDEVLRPFDRSRRVLDDPRIRKIPLPTGPQAITGSTRMQAATTSLYVLGLILEDAVRALLLPHLQADDARRLGLSEEDTLDTRLRDFAKIQQAVAATASQVAGWTVAEANAYAQNQRVTYRAQAALLQVFVDVAERSPTFRLSPLDRMDVEPPQSWIRVQSLESSAQDAWQSLLQRPFHGLSAAHYRPAFEHIDDAGLRQTALRSLENAGSEQQALYDLSLSETDSTLNALLLYTDEPLDASQQQWLQRSSAAGEHQVLVLAGPDADQRALDASAVHRVILLLPVTTIPRDPLRLNRTIALKMLLNAHSTAVMARLGRTVGNTMTAVQPGNLKLIGRATYLIQSHVNSVLESAHWQARHGQTRSLTYAEANAILFLAIDQRVALSEAAGLPEVELAIVSALEHLASGQPLDWSGAVRLLKDGGLNAYLRRYR